MQQRRKTGSAKDKTPVIDRHKPSASPVESALEQFLKAVEKKTSDPIHLRLLKVARNKNAASGLETELRTIIVEIINAT